MRKTHIDGSIFHELLRGNRAMLLNRCIGYRYEYRLSQSHHRIGFMGPRPVLPPVDLLESGDGSSFFLFFFIFFFVFVFVFVLVFIIIIIIIINIIIFFGPPRKSAGDN